MDEDTVSISKPQPAQTRIQDLASIISSATKTINEGLLAAGLPSPSFNPEAQTQLPNALSTARDQAIDAAAELYDLLLSPVDLLLHHGTHNNLASQHFIHRFAIASSFPPGTHASFEQIAAFCGVAEPRVRRLLRHAMTLRIFCEPSPGVVAHTAASAALAQKDVQDLIGANCEELWPAATRTVDALTKWPRTEEPNQTGFALANHSDLSMYQILAATPGRTQRFAGSMGGHLSGPGYEPSFLLDHYDFAALPSGAIVVDVGGSQGHIALAIVRQFPHLKVVVQDLPSVVDQTVDQVPEGLEQQLTFMAHDFFTPQPVVAEVYYFRWIFHNWSDPYCLQILRNLIPALKSGAKIIIHEHCLSTPGEIPAWRDKQFRARDITMLEILNGQEREAVEWENLFRQADSRFKFLGVRQPEGSTLSMMIAEWE